MTWYLKFVFISKLRILHDGPIIYIIELVPCKYPKEAMLKKNRHKEPANEILKCLAIPSRINKSRKSLFKKE
jgi:hypothetical protein